jgi:hypothetical protein
MPKLKIVSVAIAAFAVAIPSTALARHGQHRKGRSQIRVAGTVASFKGGVLTIKRADGTAVSAAVSPATEIECQAPEPSVGVSVRIANRDRSESGQHGGSGRGSDDNAVETENEAAENPADAAEAPGQDDTATTQTSSAGNTAQPVCDSTAFVPGAVVTSATIRTPTGGTAAFKQVKLAV